MSGAKGHDRGLQNLVSRHLVTRRVLWLDSVLTLDITHPKLRALFLCFLPPAPFPCGLIKAGLPRGASERGGDVAKRKESREGTVRQTQLEQAAAGENETLEGAFGQSMLRKGDAGQTEESEDASSWNKTLVAPVSQKPQGAGAAAREGGVPKQEGAEEGTAGPGKPQRGSAPWGELAQGPAGQNQTPAPAARQEEMVENTAGQNQTGQNDGQNKTGATRTTHEGPNHRSDQGNVSDTPQISVSSTSEHNDSRITGGTLCHRGHCPWQVMLFFQPGHRYHT